MIGIVMAGGLSSRMGRDKTRISIHGTGEPTLLESTVALLRRHTSRVYVSCRNPEEAAPFTPVLDVVERQGPFGGLYSALLTMREPLLVLSCDLPFMNDATLNRLISARNTRRPGALMTTFQQAETGFIEALVAIYEPECLALFEAARAQDIRKLSAVVPESVREHIPYTADEALPFFNINYPADVEIARRLSALLSHGTAARSPL